MSELALRLTVFLGLFVLLAALETLLPRRERSMARRGRWITNWGMTLANTLTLRLMAVLLPVLAVGAAVDAERLGIGLFNVTDWPLWLEWMLALFVLDLLIWTQHMLTHKIPFLWRLHRVHHADRDMDVTTAIRFHPVEIALSMLLKIGAIYLLGPAMGAVILFEILLNGCALFNHANIHIPRKVDRWVRLFLVTPDMHRVHHSVLRREHDSNYGFSISLWDRLFGTYRPEPEAGHDGMVVGLEWQDERPARFLWSLALPFGRK